MLLQILEASQPRVKSSRRINNYCAIVFNVCQPESFPFSTMYRDLQRTCARFYLFSFTVFLLAAGLLSLNFSLIRLQDFGKLCPFLLLQMSLGVLQKPVQIKERIAYFIFFTGNFEGFYMVSRLSQLLDHSYSFSLKSSLYFRNLY